MLSLNLLPLERKESFYWRKLSKNAIFWGTKILLILALFCASFLAIKIYLNGQISDLDREIFSFERTEKARQINSLEKSAKKINDALANINKIGEEQIYWADILDEIAETAPLDVQILSLEIDSSGKFTIVGKAKTRDDVLTLEKKLKESPDFKNIKFPYDNIVKRTNIDFKFTGNFLFENFKAKERVKIEKSDQV